jgi:hypothetical protein
MERCINKFIHNYLLALLHTNLVLQGGDSAFNKFLFITNELGKALEEVKEIWAVFFDISQAFDIVWHFVLQLKNRIDRNTGSFIIVEKNTHQIEIREL